MKRKEKNSKTLIVLLTLAIIVIVALASTYARFATKVSTTGTGTIATWNITPTIKSGVEGNTEILGTFNLSQTRTDTLKTGDIVPDGLIAPGTKGNFKIVTTGTTNVKFSYDIKLIPKSGNLPSNLTITKKIGDDTTSIKWGNGSTNAIVLDSGTDSKAIPGEILIEWEWPFEKSGNGDIDLNSVNLTGTSNVVNSTDATEASTNATSPSEFVFDIVAVAYQVNS